MRMSLDLTIGQRLAVGFGAAAILLAILLGVSEVLSARIEAMSERNTNVVAPKAAAVDAMETAILYVSIAKRSYLLFPENQRLQTYRQAMHHVHETLLMLERLPQERDGQRLFEALPSLLDRFEAAADALTHDAGEDSSSDRRQQLETALAASREALLNAVREYATLLRDKAAHTQAMILEAQHDMTRSVATFGGLMFLLLGLTGIVTSSGVRRPALKLVEASREIAAGNFGPALALSVQHVPDGGFRNELTELSQSFSRMALNLEAREKRLRAGSELSAVLAENLEMRRLCEAGLQRIIGYLGVEIGGIYLLEDGTRLRRRFAIGLTGNEELAVGEGIPGRAAQTRQTVAVEEIPQDSPFTIRLGMDNLPPRAVMATPMVLQNRNVVGVIVIGSLHPLAPETIGFLEHAATQLAISIQNAQRHAQIRHLASELQEKNETLQMQYGKIQAQQEELQARNEEIQAQNEELQAQSEELKAQGDELRGTVERLTESEEQYHGLFSHLSEGFALHEIVYDHAGRPAACRVLAVNDAFRQATGLGTKQIVGVAVGNADAKMGMPSIETLAAVVRTGEPLRFEYQSESHGKHYHAVAFRVNQRQFATLYMDITNQKRAEEALRDADRNKNEFLAVLSHELRNPLAPIKNGLYILSRAQPGSEQAIRAQQVIERQVEQLARLVEDLLDVTRVSSGKVQLRRSHLDLCTLVHQAVEDTRALFAQRDIAVGIVLADGHVPVYADPVRLSQVIGNLLQNAAKFTPEGGRVDVTIETERAIGRIRVRDSGTGMAPETIARLFQPFMQVDTGLARTDGGLGLGLALVKALVEMHGGTVCASSKGRGKGSEFVIELPIAHDVAREVKPEGVMPRMRRRVLVVEDNIDAANSLREALSFGGHEVEVAHMGAEGIARARNWHPEVLLCDIGLPDIDGHDVARAFRNDPALRSVFLVALTGYALSEDVKRANDAGFNEHVSKPPSIERLEEILARAPIAAA